MTSLWSYHYQENIDELKEILLYKSIELEQLKMESSEELHKNMQLLHLLKIVCQERDEARDELQNLENKIMLSSSEAEELFFFNGIPQLLHHYPAPADNSPIFLKNPNLIAPNYSSLKAESKSHSETYNYYNHHHHHYSHGFENIAAFENHPLMIIHQECNNDNDYNVDHDHVHVNVAPSGIQKIDDDDEATLVIDSLVNGKSLPRRGNFLKAVVDSGPLLQNLLVAGPIPRWRNPPPLQLHTYIP